MVSSKSYLSVTRGDSPAQSKNTDSHNYFMPKQFLDSLQTTSVSKYFEAEWEIQIEREKKSKITL